MDVQRATLPVLVGIDGSQTALAAARWAAREADHRRARLRIVYAGGWPTTGTGRWPGPDVVVSSDVLLRSARAQIEAAAAAARAEAPGLAVQAEVLPGHPVPRLIAESGSAQLAVVGNRGSGGVSRLLIGSVAAALAAHAACPVVVVRDTEPGAQDGPVVVGVDGSEISEAALEFAFDAAAARRAPLWAVHVWADTVLHPARAPSWDWDGIEQEQHLILAERLAGWSAKYPDVPVRRVIERDRPARVLVEKSVGAQLVVVGSHGRGEVSGLLLGSVGHALLHRAHAPVAIVRPVPEPAP